MVAASQLSDSTRSSGTSEQPATGGNKALGKSGANKVKPSYKHVPHSQKPPHLVAKRNARERRRVQAVNQAFYKLRRCVPIENRNKRVSKVKTLQRAIDYIRKLERILEDDDNQQQQSQIVLVSGQLQTGGQPTATQQQQQQQANSSSSSGSQQAGKKRRTRVKSSTNCDQASLNQIQPEVAKPRRGRKPLLIDADRLVEPVASVTETGSGQMGSQPLDARFVPGEMQQLGHEHYYTGGLSSECAYDQPPGEMMRDSGAYASNLPNYFADQLEQHYSGAGHQHYLAAEVSAPLPPQHQQGGHYFDMYQGGYSAPPASFYAGSAGSHIGSGYKSMADTSSSSSSYRQPPPHQQQAWHEPANLLLEGQAGSLTGKAANLNDSVASSPSSAGSASTRTSTSLNSSSSTTSNGNRASGNGINNKPSESSSSSASATSSCSSAATSSSSANLAVSFALLQSPSSSSSANSSMITASTDCSALSKAASSSSPSQQASTSALATNTGDSSPMAASNDNSSTPVVVRQPQQQQRQQALQLAAACNRQQVNNCLAYAANGNGTHLSFAVNNGARDNNDNNNASYHHHNHHNHQRQLLNERKTALTCSIASASNGSNRDELRMTIAGNASNSSSGVHHQVRHPMSGGGGNNTGHLNGGFSANNLHEQAHTLQYHQQQQQLHHHHQHHHNQQPFLSNQLPRSAHLSASQQPSATLLDSSTATSTNSLVPNQHRQTIQEYTNLPL